MGEPQVSTVRLAHGEGLSEITFSNAWNALGETWSVLGIVPGWARGRVFVCPTCLAPAVATDVYKGGRGDVPCVECVAGHIIERNGSEVTAILAIVKQVINARATSPWPTGQNIYVTSDLWLTSADGHILLAKSQHSPQPVGLLCKPNGVLRWRPLPDTEIRQAIEKLKRRRA